MLILSKKKTKLLRLLENINLPSSVSLLTGLLQKRSTTCFVVDCFHVHAKNIIIYTVQCRDRVCCVVSEDHGQTRWSAGKSPSYSDYCRKENPSSASENEYGSGIQHELTWERSEFSDPMGCNEFSLVLVCAIGARVRQPDCPHSAYICLQHDMISSAYPISPGAEDIWSKLLNYILYKFDRSCAATYQEDLFSYEQKLLRETTNSANHDRTNLPKKLRRCLRH